MRKSVAAVFLFAACGGPIGTADDQNVTEEIRAPKLAPPTAEQEEGLRQDFSVSAEEANFKLWSTYCIGDAEVKVKPVPNMSNSLVAAAAANLSKVAGHSFALYSSIKRHHSTPLPAEQASQGVTQDAWDFLSYTCGEFRDRATMVEAKLTYFGNRFNFLEDKMPEAFDPTRSPWEQMVVSDYPAYIQLSSWVFTQREISLPEHHVTIGSVTADASVPGFTVCETKYMFSEYIRKGKTFDGYEAYTAGLDTYRAGCSPDDLEYYYDFRGDSNSKPNSPESNGMIWFSQMMANQCASMTETPYQEVNKDSSMPVENCRAYFKYPFASRWNGARAGLAAWVMTDPRAAGQDSKSVFKVVPKALGDATYFFGDKTPYTAFGADGQPFALLAGWEEHFSEPTLGLGTLLGGDPEKLQRILQIAVDRHTDWYASQWDDEQTYKRNTKTQAYSPFVASSYEMSASDGFVSCGTTVPCIDPTAAQFKHWMFVFRVKKANWFTPERVKAGEQMDFDRMWLDETSFGDTPLANHEKAWDRLGTPLEPELLGGAALYLRNVPRW